MWDVCRSIIYAIWNCIYVYIIYYYLYYYIECNCDSKVYVPQKIQRNIFIRDHL